VRTGLLFDGRLVSVLALVKECPADCLHPHWHGLDAAWVAEIKAAGLAINTYTVNQEDEYQWIADLSVDGIFSNFPDRAAEWTKGISGERSPATNL
jgi:glycerophosphoryl diester phosphodiesterase